MQDTYDTIAQALPAVAPMLSPAKATAVMDVLIDTSPLPADIKKKFRDAGENEAQQPDPKLQESMAKIAAQKEESKGKMEIAQLEAAAEMKVEREKASNQIAIERDKANNAINLEIFKAQQVAKTQREETVRTAIEARNANPPPPDHITPLLQRHEQLITGLVQHLSKPRRAVIHRDPRTNRVSHADLEG